MTDWDIVYSDVKPAEFDATSSKYFVYQRRNAQLVTFTDDNGGTYETWQYEERKLSHGEYEKLLADENTNLQLALTELYEELLQKG